jgi:hypothetical protein
LLTQLRVVITAFVEQFVEFTLDEVCYEAFDVHDDVPVSAIGLILSMKQFARPRIHIQKSHSGCYWVRRCL